VIEPSQGFANTATLINRQTSSTNSLDIFVKSVLKEDRKQFTRQLVELKDRKKGKRIIIIY
jgi:hypothetical protein